MCSNYVWFCVVMAYSESGGWGLIGSFLGFILFVIACVAIVLFVVFILIPEFYRDWRSRRKR